jgi:hypothetical protein
LEALQSEHWLHVRLDTVQDVLRLEHSTASEADLVRALLRWGRAQLHPRHADNPAIVGQKVYSRFWANSTTC